MEDVHILKYMKDMFRHYNPLILEYYDYYIRCVNRFRELLNNTNNKLFMVFYPNHNNKDIINIKKDLEKLNDILQQKTTNFKILCVFHFSNRNNRYEFYNENNIDYLLLSTKSKCYGLKFINDNDNSFFDYIFNNLYKFNINNELNKNYDLNKNNSDNNIYIT